MKRQVAIEYCGVWNYYPRASGLEARIRAEFPDTEVELIRSGGGVFEVTVDGKLIFSKKQLGRHAEWEEIRERLKEAS